MLNPQQTILDKQHEWKRHNTDQAIPLNPVVCCEGPNDGEIKERGNVHMDLYRMETDFFAEYKKGSSHD
ncbi:hypothetical protein [Lacunimicrobium album]